MMICNVSIAGLSDVPDVAAIVGLGVGLRVG